MTERPLYQFWPVFLALGLFLGFALFNLYCALVYGTIIGSRRGDGWVTFGARPYLFSLFLIVHLLTVVFFGAALVRISQFVLYRAGLLGRKQHGLNQGQPK